MRQSHAGGRPRWPRAWLHGVAAVILLAFAAAVARKVVGVAHELHPPRKAVGSIRAHPDLGAVEQISLTTADGVRLAGWWSPGSNGAAVILVHGYEGNREQLAHLAGPLARAGFGILLLDLRDHGESGESACTWGDRERLDVAAAVDRVLATPGVHSVGVAGFSIGGLAAAGDAAVDRRIAAVALLATQPTLEDELRNDHRSCGWPCQEAEVIAFRAAGVHVGEVSPLSQLCRIAPRPVLLVYGGADRVAPVEGGERLAQNCCGACELLVVPGADHGGWEQVAPGLVPARVTAFFARALR